MACRASQLVMVVESIVGQTFAFCGSLTNVVFGSSVIAFAGTAFWHCTNLPSLAIQWQSSPTLAIALSRIAAP